MTQSCAAWFGAGECGWRFVMVEAAKSLFLILSALFPIVDPLGGSPVFLSMTRDYSPEVRKELSWQIAMNSFFLLVGSYFIGTYILRFFGISIPVVQVGGGLIVVSNGWSLLQRGNYGQKEVAQNVVPQDPYRDAFYPLTLPLTVGPGSVSSGAPFVEHVHGVCRLCPPGCEHLSLLQLRRSLGPRAGHHGHDRYLAVDLVFAGVHWRADSLEWGQRAAEVAASRHALKQQ